MSDDSGVKDTTAYEVIRQITDHIWGDEEELDDGDVLRICSDFTHRGGSWEALVNGSMDCVVTLEASIEGFVKGRAAQQQLATSRSLRK